MSETLPYATPAGVEAAIRAAAKKAMALDPSVNVQDLIRQAGFDRFLCRVFSDEAESGWVLKGGTGMLARVPSTRSTLDVDLYRAGFTIEQAMADLKRLAGVDLGDHFRFVYSRHEPTVAGDTQPYTEGYRVVFDVYIGVKKSSPVSVDLAVGAGVTAAVDVVEPANRLMLPRLKTHEYRLYPVVDQIADKVCATMTTYVSGESTREKDLVDLVVLANTQDVDARALRLAVQTECRRRGLEPFTTFRVPASWGASYTGMARKLPHCAGREHIDDALKLMASFLTPVLTGSAGTWSHLTCRWE
jgi:hypothetical protein